MTHPVLYSVDFGGCALVAALSDEEASEAFAAALERAGATIVNRVAHRYPGKGLTCVLVLQESHAVLHTWPETGTVNLDIFSCSPRLRGDVAIAELERCFGAARVSVQTISRDNGYERSTPR